MLCTNRRVIRAAAVATMAGMAMFVCSGMCCSGNCIDGRQSPFEAKVNPEVKPEQPTLPDGQGSLMEIASSRDAHGVKSDFVVGLVTVNPKTEADLKVFLDRYGGVVVDDNTIPKPPPELGITLTDEQRKPTQFTVRIDLAKVDASRFSENAVAAGRTGVMEYSSDAGLHTVAAVADAIAAGFSASPAYVDSPSVVPTEPYALLGTQERSDGAGKITDALTLTRLGSAIPVFGAQGSRSNVALAWQFLAANGVRSARPVRVAIIDTGFWLNADGTPRGTDSDFPAHPIQHDFSANRDVADGPNTNPCAVNTPCFWHGTGSAGVATGLLNNHAGAAGTGGLVAEPMLFKRGTVPQQNEAIRTAVAWGADVVSMSYGSDANEDRQAYDAKNNEFNKAVDAGSRTVFVASAGNGRNRVGYNVDDSIGDGKQVFHPCVQDHVICVGAVNEDTTKVDYSNFGDGVDIFAPTKIPVMSYPPSNDPTTKQALPLSQAYGTEEAQEFEGTSASAPFVSGIVAMMKGVNPDLTSDQVSTILRETAHTGTGPVTRYVDAYVALRRAAESFVSPDGFDKPTRHDNTPLDLTMTGPYKTGLSLDSADDRDLFSFNTVTGATLTIDLQYPEGLGTIKLSDFQALDICGHWTLDRDDDLGPNQGHRFTYNLSAGQYQFTLSAGDINAYNLFLNFNSFTLPDDLYEKNNTQDKARALGFIGAIRTMPDGTVRQIPNSPRVTIDATISTKDDVDWYEVRGAQLTTSEQALLNGYPVLSIDHHDSAINVEILKDGNRYGLGAAGACGVKPLSFYLEQDVTYLVKVSGDVGRYTLRNGVDGDRRHVPELVQEKPRMIDPIDPVGIRLHDIERYVYVADPAYKEVHILQAGPHLRLLDFDGNTVAEGQAGEPGTGERMHLAGALANHVYTMEIAPSAGAAEQDISLEWQAASPLRVSDNLVFNGNADVVPAGDNPTPGWFDPTLRRIGGAGVAAYGDANAPAATDPGPDNRGLKLFIGGTGNDTSVLRQNVAIDPTWQQAINDGHVKFKFSGFLGGYLNEMDTATASLTFLDLNRQTLGSISLSSVTAEDRNNLTGLLPVQRLDYVPAGTTQVYVDLTFQRFSGNDNDGYADNLELVLSDFSR